MTTIAIGVAIGMATTFTFRFALNLLRGRRRAITLKKEIAEEGPVTAADLIALKYNASGHITGFAELNEMRKLVKEIQNEN